jgi:glyoxylate/hydroxypyruvate reductase A
MKLLLAGQWGEREEARWRAALAAALPEAQWHTPASLHDAAAATRARIAGEIEAAVVANPPPGTLQGLPRLRLIQSLWAGVDRLLADATLPTGVPIARMVDPAMTAAMVETALWAVLALHRGFFAYQQRQREQVWRQHRQRRADELGVLVLGQGTLGGAVAEALRGRGYRVAGWRREGAQAEDFEARLAAADILVNLLPLTEATRGLLDARLFARLPRGAGLVNLARGAHLVEADLLAALDAGQLRHAVLDVFQTEPLPAAHPFWRHPRITVLPHAAALTDERSAAAVAAANLRALRDGRPLQHRVDRVRGY